MKVGEVWVYNPSIYVNKDDMYFYNGKVKIKALFWDEVAGDCVEVTLEDGSSPKAVDSMSHYRVEMFLGIYTKVY